MIFNTLENYLRNFSFVLLFFTMLLYWTKASFFHKKKTTKIENFALVICNISLVSILFIRWIESNHFPLSNLYESLLFLSWSLLTVLLILQLKTKELFLGTILTPIALFTNTFATFTLPSDMQKASSLVPALQSNWLMMHVTIMMLSYAALICGSLLAITFLVINTTLITENKSENLKTNFELSSNLNLPLQKKTLDNEILLFNSNSIENQLVPGEQNSKKKLLIKLDNLSYRTIGIGFPLLTIGILSGAVWANETWGSYWSWDPKETWALITWIIYAIYLHSRIIRGWMGEKPAFLASFGFLAVWICYLGVNIFGKGLHSYGWFDIT